MVELPEALLLLWLLLQLLLQLQQQAAEPWQPSSSAEPPEQRPQQSCWQPWQPLPAAGLQSSQRPQQQLQRLCGLLQST